MRKANNSKIKYICCRYCMEINHQLLIPCAKLINGINLKLYTCPKKERHDPHSKTLKPKWEEITEVEYSKIYELSIALSANTKSVVIKNNEITFKNLRRVQNKNSNN